MANTKTYFLDNRVVKASKSVESLKKLKDLFNLNELITKISPPYEPSFSVYTALLTVDTGTTTVVILENTIGNIIWTNPSNGVLRGTLAASFPIAKSFVSIGGYSDNFITGYVPSANFVQITIKDKTGGQTGTPNITNVPLEIRVYN